MKQKYHEIRFGSKATVNDHKFSMSVTNADFHIFPNWKKTPEQDACVIHLPSSVADAVAENCDFACATRACLPTAPAVPGEACWAGGHGATDYDDYDSTPVSMKSAGLNIFSEAYAKKKVKQTVLRDVDFKWMIIAGLPDRNNDGLADGGTDSCSGNSGSGLMCREGIM